MSIKVMVLLRKLPGLSDDEFREYYESHHVGLVQAILPPIARYLRHYIVRDSAEVTSQAGTRAEGIDVITELHFPDRTALELFRQRMRDPAISGRLAEDEAKLFDLSSRQSYVVETVES